jgi:hypothetical protein
MGRPVTRDADELDDQREPAGVAGEMVSVQVGGGPSTVDAGVRLDQHAAA